MAEARQLPEARYKHDCDECIYLGHMGRYDVWYHPGLSPAYTDELVLMLRYGPEGEYVSRSMAILFPGQWKEEAL